MRVRVAHLRCMKGSHLKRFLLGALSSVTWAGASARVNQRQQAFLGKSQGYEARKEGTCIR